MKINIKKLIFYLIWLVLISLGTVTVLNLTPLSALQGNKVLFVNFLQRVFGLTAFSMMFVQILLGAFMTKWTERLGGWVFKFHIVQGVVIYLLIILHGLSYAVINYFVKGNIDPFYVFVDICILCKGKFEWFYNVGRIAFWLITLSVVAGYFRTANSFLRVHWKKFHIFNYIAFLLIFFHSLKLGNDVGTFPFSLIHTPSAIVVFGIIVWKVKGYFQLHTSKGKEK